MRRRSLPALLAAALGAAGMARPTAARAATPGYVLFADPLPTDIRLGMTATQVAERIRAFQARQAADVSAVLNAQLEAHLLQGGRP